MGSYLIHDPYLRAGLVEYLQEHKDPALAFFEKAKPLEPKRNLIVVQGYIPTGIERLIDVAKSGQMLTPEGARKGDDKAKLILMLADVYRAANEWQKSLGLCDIVAIGAVRKATREQQSWAIFVRARDEYSIAGADPTGKTVPDNATADYVSAYQVSPKSDWADTALLFAGNIHWNYHQDADGAIALYRKLIREYPKGKEAEEAAFCIGVAYEYSKRPREAVAAYQALVDAKPGSRFTPLARESIQELLAPPKKQ